MGATQQHHRAVTRSAARFYHAARSLPPSTGPLLATISVVIVLQMAAGGAGNANTLIAFGPPLERVYGAHRFALIYLGVRIAGPIACAGQRYRDLEDRFGRWCAYSGRQIKN